MKFGIAIFWSFVLTACVKNTQVHTPIGMPNKEDLNISQNRAKQLNQIERKQISDWISQQNKKFYSTELNYWTDIENLDQRNRKKDGEHISFQYKLYDFAQTQLYEKPKIYKEAILGKFKELEAIDNAVRYLVPGEETILLVPSVLAYGTYGDGNQIPHDMPIIIKLKLIN